MSEALYRKYRPSTFDDIVGQEHIERTLKNALEQQKVSHAYLFCGPRGTGKTTMARILAKALLCEKAPTIEPDGTCEECVEIAAGTHPDVYELDAASRTGVENVREEIINRVHYAPTRGSYKIYIIDEVHMLSTAAFNALLKTLEEPPSHVVFILCTTDPQKVPDTIHSRCQRFDFHRLSVDEIVARLGAVCVQEDVEFEPEALELIAHQAEGGMRNALTSLEQLAAFGEGRVTLEGARRILGSLDNEGLSEIVQALGKRDAAACFTWVSRYVETGADVAQFVQELAEHMRNLYLLSLTDAEVEIPVSSSARASMESELEFFGPERLSRALSVLGELIKELRATTNSRLAFEIALTRLLRPESDLTMESLAERLEELELKMLSMPRGSAFDAVPIDQSAAVAPSVAPSVIHPQPAPQPIPQPQPQPAPQPVPAPQPTPVQQPIAPTPAQQAAAPLQDATASQPAPSSGQEAASTTQVAPAALDFSNAAALQRMWHQVTTSLRKSNPARGVLFMGAKIEPGDQAGAVRIVFSPDSSFAYAAAQKKEVKDLLAQTFIDLLGGSVPFELVMAKGQGGQASAVMTSQLSTPPMQPSAPSPAPAASSSVAPAMQQPVAAAQASQTPSIPTPQAAADPASQMPVAQPQSTSGVRYDDESPFMEDEAPIDYQPQASSTFSPVVSAPQQSAPVVEPSAPSNDETMDESDQIKQILTASFGDGVKFDTM
jgi:DNA polymerase-3 subunit gamma/tau